MLKQVLQVYTEGPVVFKLCSSGCAALLSAMNDVWISISFTVLALFWFLDMITGAARAIARSRGFVGFSMWKFFEGFLKLLAALAGVALARGLDLLAQDQGLGIQIFTPGATIGLAVGFAASVVQSLGHWFPGVSTSIGKRLSLFKETEESPR